ncbi:RnfABCDGE type electron transport complex subunit D [Cohnella candidum]|uniref:RnfABCDGE type electron transport complex subunit D n=1 Tax=Cohnella candidum TaxID=2674991 RepID=A0A3G3JSJ4_9BACL|nr:RnfABCDGE type electron transport complex subunit D [Cohnella candidum]AYQ71162.1 hypothetical protein EAV92_00175 [Cohnella candidum]
MKFRQWVKTPKALVLVVLTVYLAIAALGSHAFAAGMKHGAIAVGSALAVDIICCLFERRKRILPDGAFITGLIVALVLGFTSAWYIVAATSTLAILPKHLLVRKKKPIFNPAAAGLLLSVLLFQSQQSWWGAFGDLSPWYLALIFIGGYFVTHRINKFPLVFSFLGTYLILLYVLGMGVIPAGTGFLDAAGVSDALQPPFINAALFFALIMLTDPPTSPNKNVDQIVFGFLTAAVSAGVYAYFGGLMYLFIGLLAGNVYHLLRSMSTQNARQAKPAAGSRTAPNRR